MPDLQPSILEALQQYDTPTVCNVIELFEVRPRTTGYMGQNIVAAFPDLPPMVGLASTATFRALAAPPSGNSYSGFDEQLKILSETELPSVVVFQDLDVPSAAATFGEVMCSTYKSFGSSGLITSGTGRDIDQVRPLKYPVYTAGTCCSHGNCHIPSVNVPIVVGGISIQPGDLLHGDCNGVTTIPIDIADEIPDACKDFMAAEKHVLDYVNSQPATVAGFIDARNALSEAIDGLRNRLRRR